MPWLVTMRQKSTKEKPRGRNSRAPRGSKILCSMFDHLLIKPDCNHSMVPSSAIVRKFSICSSTEQRRLYKSNGTKMGIFKFSKFFLILLRNKSLNLPWSLELLRKGILVFVFVDWDSLSFYFLGIYWTVFDIFWMLLNVCFF